MGLASLSCHAGRSRQRAQEEKQHTTALQNILESHGDIRSQPIIAATGVAGPRERNGYLDQQHPVSQRRRNARKSPPSSALMSRVRSRQRCQHHRCRQQRMHRQGWHRRGVYVLGCQRLVPAVGRPQRRILRAMRHRHAAAMRCHAHIRNRHVDARTGIRGQRNLLQQQRRHRQRHKPQAGTSVSAHASFHDQQSLGSLDYSPVKCRLPNAQHVSGCAFDRHQRRPHRHSTTSYQGLGRGFNPASPRRPPTADDTWCQRDDVCRLHLSSSRRRAAILRPCLGDDEPVGRQSRRSLR